MMIIGGGKRRINISLWHGMFLGNARDCNSVQWQFIVHRSLSHNHNFLPLQPLITKTSVRVCTAPLQSGSCLGAHTAAERLNTDPETWERSSGCQNLLLQRAQQTSSTAGLLCLAGAGASTKPKKQAESSWSFWEEHSWWGEWKVHLYSLPVRGCTATPPAEHHTLRIKPQARQKLEG